MSKHAIEFLVAMNVALILASIYAIHQLHISDRGRALPHLKHPVKAGTVVPMGRRRIAQSTARRLAERAPVLRLINIARSMPRRSRVQS